MLLSKLKFAFLGLVTVALVTAGAGVAAQDRPSDEDRLKSVERKLDRLLEAIGGHTRHAPEATPPPDAPSAGGAPTIAASPAATPAPSILPPTAPVPAPAQPPGPVQAIPAMPAQPPAAPAAAPAPGTQPPQPVTMPPAPFAQPNSLARRVDMLEQRSTKLEKRLADFEQRLSRTSSGSSPSNLPRTSRSVCPGAEVPTSRFDTSGIANRSDPRFCSCLRRWSRADPGSNRRGRSSTHRRTRDRVRVAERPGH